CDSRLCDWPQERPRQPASMRCCCCRGCGCSTSRKETPRSECGNFWRSGRRRRREKGASIVTWRSCFPCRELGRLSPPRCSQRLGSPSENEIIRLYGIMQERLQ